jgi:hypothetical protein
LYLFIVATRRSFDGSTLVAAASLEGVDADNEGEEDARGTATPASPAAGARGARLQAAFAAMTIAMQSERAR